MFTTCPSSRKWPERAGRSGKKCKVAKISKASLKQAIAATSSSGSSQTRTKMLWTKSKTPEGIRSVAPSHSGIYAAKTSPKRSHMKKMTPLSATWTARWTRYSLRRAKPFA